MTHEARCYRALRVIFDFLLHINQTALLQLQQLCMCTDFEPQVHQHKLGLRGKAKQSCNKKKYMHAYNAGFLISNIKCHKVSGVKTVFGVIIRHGMEANYRLFSSLSSLTPFT